MNNFDEDFGDSPTPEESPDAFYFDEQVDIWGEAHLLWFGRPFPTLPTGGIPFGSNLPTE